MDLIERWLIGCKASRFGDCPSLTDQNKKMSQNLSFSHLYRIEQKKIRFFFFFFLSSSI